MAIDYDEARKRIILRFVTGMLRTYGVRRMKKVKQKFMKPGPTYWNKKKEWVDPFGVKRVGGFQRMPSTEVEQEIEIPQGVVPDQILEYGSAMADAFLEVLRIAEENSIELKHVEHPFVEGA